MSTIHGCVVAADSFSDSQPRLHSSAAHKRHILSILDLSSEQVMYLCQRAIQIKRARSPRRTLHGRTVGIYFRRQASGSPPLTPIRIV